MKATLSIGMTDEFGFRRKFATDLNSSALDAVTNAFVEAMMGFGYARSSIEDCLIEALQEYFGFDVVHDSSEDDNVGE